MENKKYRNRHKREREAQLGTKTQITNKHSGHETADCLLYQTHLQPTSLVPQNFNLTRCFICDDFFSAIQWS